MDSPIQKRGNDDDSNESPKKLKTESDDNFDDTKINAEVRDMSGSMHGNKNNQMQIAMKESIDQADDKTGFIITSFSDESKIHSELPMNKTEAQSVLASLNSCGGGTALYTAVKVTANQLIEYLDKNQNINPKLVQMRILTDGENNRNDEDAAPAKDRVKILLDRGCIVSLLQAGSSNAADVLGLPEDAVLYFDDNAHSLGVAMDAYRTQSEGHRTLVSLRQPSHGISYTPAQRTASQSIEPDYNTGPSSPPRPPFLRRQ